MRSIKLFVGGWPAVAVLVLTTGWISCGSPVDRPLSSPSRVETATIEAPSPPSVELTSLGEGVWLHTSVRVLEPHGRVVSHGLVLRGHGGAVLVDTAWGTEATRMLLRKVQQTVGEPVVAALITDFHADRSGGVETLDRAGVEVHTSRGIIERLAIGRFAKPLVGAVVASSWSGVELEVFAPGPGHSSENLVVWVPKHRLLFGGCLLRRFDRSANTCRQRATRSPRSRSISGIGTTRRPMPAVARRDRMPGWTH